MEKKLKKKFDALYVVVEELRDRCAQLDAPKEKYLTKVLTKLDAVEELLNGKLADDAKREKLGKLDLDATRYGVDDIAGAFSILGFKDTHSKLLQTWIDLDTAV
jgi:hypothetical protein